MTNVPEGQPYYDPHDFVIDTDRHPTSKRLPNPCSRQLSMRQGMEHRVDDIGNSQQLGAKGRQERGGQAVPSSPVRTPSRQPRRPLSK